MTLDAYTKYFRSRVQLYEALGLIVGATDARDKVVAQEDIIDVSNSSNANKWKSDIDKSEVQFQAAMYFNGLKNVIYKGLKAKVKNN